MKNKTKLLSVFLFLCLSCSSQTSKTQVLALKQTGVASGNEWDVAGGRLSFDFSEESQLSSFQNYSVYGKKAYILDGRLYTWLMCEQKLSLSNFQFKDVSVEVDVSALKEGGKINGGIYLASSKYGDPQDQVTGWNVQVEHGVDFSYYKIRIHHFDQAWMGQVAESSPLPYRSDTVHLRVASKSGILYVFADKGKSPVLTYPIGDEEGRIGLRGSYFPGYFDNLTIIAPQFQSDASKFDALLEKFNALDENNYTPSSFSKAKTFFSQMALVDLSLISQNEIDGWARKGEEEIASLVLRRSYEELQGLIEKAEAITNAGSIYTQDSYRSFSLVLSYAKALTETDGVDALSYWYKALDYRMEELVLYKETAK